MSNPILCGCGQVTRCRTSWTQHNPRRRFIGCPNYLDPLLNCNFIRWVDMPLPNHWFVYVMVVVDHGPDVSFLPKLFIFNLSDTSALVLHPPSVLHHSSVLDPELVLNLRIAMVVIH
ncbi:DNA-(apurinic or apyrimidinic site) lyase 2 [Tanacetum coccineum]